MPFKMLYGSSLRRLGRVGVLGRLVVGRSGLIRVLRGELVVDWGRLVVDRCRLIAGRARLIFILLGLVVRWGRV
jgi:hypothetical protein